MKANIISLALLFWAGFCCAQSEQYCNTDFGFCLEYPTEFSMLTAKGGVAEPVRFVANEGQAQVEIRGHSNPDQWSLEDIYYMNFEDLLRQNPDLDILEEAFTEDQFEVLYQEKGQLHFFRVQQQPGQYITLSVVLPAGQKDRLSALRAQLNVQHPTP